MSATTYTMQDTAAAIRALEGEFERHAIAGDAAALTESYCAEDCQLLPPNTPVVKGKAAIREFWTGFIAAGCTDVELITGDVSASGELAYSVGSYGYTANGARHAGKYLVVYQRQSDGGYKAIADSFSDNS
jgi:ketosteroid isomerase-like protein